MATYVVRTTIQPDVEYEVDEAEYDRLVELGLLLDGPVQPTAPVFDQTVHDLVENATSLTHQAILDVAGVVPATPTTRGVLKLTGDLGGAADAPTVPALANKVGTTDPRLSDQRIPADGSVTDAKVNSSAAISLSKLKQTDDMTARSFNTNSTVRSAFFKTTSAADHAVTVYQASTSGVDVAAALNVTSDNPQTSAMYLSGTETNRGTLKIAHRGSATGADSGAAGISMDLQTSGSAARGIFVWSSTGGVTGDPLCVRFSATQDDFVVKSTGRVGIGITQGATPAGKLEIQQHDDTTPGISILANSTTASNLIEFKRSTDGAIRTRVDSQAQFVTQQISFFSGSGIMVGSTSTQFGGGTTGMIGIANRGTAPTANPTGGGVLYSENGTLTWMGTSGSAVPVSAPTSTNITDATSVGRSVLTAASTSAARAAIGAGNVTGSGVTTVSVLTQAAYTALAAKDSATLYVIQG